MTTQAVVRLGEGHLASFVWREGTDRIRGIPVGVLERHGACAVYVSWVHDTRVDMATAAATAWTLRSLVPLTLIEPILCPQCSVVGRIIEGRWVPCQQAAG